MKCPNQDCSVFSFSIPSLRVHFLNIHKNAAENIEDQNEAQNAAPNNEAQNEAEEAIVEARINPLPFHAVLSAIETKISENYVSFFLQARDIHCLADSTATKLARLFHSFHQESTSAYLNLFKSFLNENEIHLNDDIFLPLELDNFFESSDCLISDVNISAILQDHYNYIGPVEFSFPNTRDKLYYVSIQETITSVSKNNDLLAYLKYISPNSSLFSTKHYTDLLHLADKAIYIKLYMDEFEVCNPIGISRKKHKLVALYFSILNFPEEINSKLKTIHLICLGKQELYNHVGSTEFLKPLLDELNHLYLKGMEISDSKLSVIAAGMCGDNLSINPLVGLNSCFSSGYICRFCNVQHQQLREHRCNVSSLRTHDGYIDDIAQKTHGIVSNSPFLNLPYIDFVTFFPPDVMHDCLEGVSHGVAIIVLKKLLTKVNLQEINSILLNFNFGISLCFITRLQLKKGKLLIKASDMLKFLLYLPLVIGNWFDTNDLCWRLLLLHCELLHISLDRNANTPLDHFTCLIEEHNCLYYNLSANGKPMHKCKLHYLSHYPSLLQHYGSFKTYWAMRFEGKHQYFKNLIRTTQQFKNVAYTCSFRHQVTAAVLNSIANSDQVASTKTVFGSVMNTLVLEEVDSINMCLDTPLHFEEQVFTCESVTKDSATYSTVPNKPTAIVFNFSEFANADVYSLERIINIRQSFYLLAKKFDVIYHPHFNTYAVKSKSLQITTFSLSKLSHISLPIHTVRCVRCICIPFTFISDNV